MHTHTCTHRRAHAIHLAYQPTHTHTHTVHRARYRVHYFGMPHCFFPPNTRCARTSPARLDVSHTGLPTNRHDCLVLVPRVAAGTPCLRTEWLTKITPTLKPTACVNTALLFPLSSLIHCLQWSDSYKSFNTWPEAGEHGGGFPGEMDGPVVKLHTKKSPPIISVEINRCELEGKIWLYDIIEGRLAGFKSSTASKHRGWCKKWAPFVTLHKGNTRNRSSVTPSLKKNHNFCLDTAYLA